MYTGKGCEKHFVKTLLKIKQALGNYMKTIKPIDMSDEDVINHENAEVCYICNEGDFTSKELKRELWKDKNNKTQLIPYGTKEPRNFAEELFLMSDETKKQKWQNIKVRDHCHFTGKYRGAAHSKCNLSYKKATHIPVIAHNSQNYDSHLFIKELAELCTDSEQVITKIREIMKEEVVLKKWQKKKYVRPQKKIEKANAIIKSKQKLETLVEELNEIKKTAKDQTNSFYKFSCIAQTDEKYNSWSVSSDKISLRFIDSCKFMTSKLEDLVKNNVIKRKIRDIVKRFIKDNATHKLTKDEVKTIFKNFEIKDLPKDKIINMIRDLLNNLIKSEVIKNVIVESFIREKIPKCEVGKGHSCDHSCGGE